VSLVIAFGVILALAIVMSTSSLRFPLVGPTDFVIVAFAIILMIWGLCLVLVHATRQVILAHAIASCCFWRAFKLCGSAHFKR
jgi:hypothetical protein